MNKALFIVILLLLSFSFSEGKENKRIIRIALYDSISPSVNLIEKACHYGWIADKNYEMEVERIGYKEVMEGLSSYDVLVIGASGRQYFHGLNPKWRENVKKFIANGGGYVGICGGANIMSKGYEKPRHPLDFIITKSALEIVDAYINDDQCGEWQYLWKEGVADEPPRGNIPIKNEIVANHPIFAGMKERYITYGGGPGLYGMKNAKGLAVYTEEPMDVAPLHYWIWLGKWIPYKKIRTDIKGYYSCAEAKYGKGKVIIFGGHPEIPPSFNASIVEYFGLSIYNIPRFVYAWKGGEQKNYSYNWWILRRSIAYVCNLPLPPAEELYVELGINGNQIEAYAENAEKVEFYVEGELYFIDSEPPFKFNFDLQGKHVIKAIAYSSNAYAWDEKEVENDNMRKI
ncbi:MAG TPA: hypothetical protein ENG71_04150 [Thermoplasmatales archaeon]|nr:hypothetical protein [Thermoplasmatales archaeon]